MSSGTLNPLDSKVSHREGPRRAAAPPVPLLSVSNVTAHPSSASVPVTVLLYDGPLLCGFNVAIKGLNYHTVFPFSQTLAAENNSSPTVSTG